MSDYCPKCEAPTHLCVCVSPEMRNAIAAAPPEAPNFGMKDIYDVSKPEAPTLSPFEDKLLDTLVAAHQPEAPIDYQAMRDNMNELLLEAIKPEPPPTSEDKTYIKWLEQELVKDRSRSVGLVEALQRVRDMLATYRRKNTFNADLALKHVREALTKYGETK